MLMPTMLLPSRAIIFATRCRADADYAVHLTSQATPLCCHYRFLPFIRYTVILNTVFLSSPRLPLMLLILRFFMPHDAAIYFFFFFFL